MAFCLSPCCMLTAWRGYRGLMRCRPEDLFLLIDPAWHLYNLNRKDLQTLWFRYVTTHQAYELYSLKYTPLRNSHCQILDQICRVRNQQPNYITRSTRPPSIQTWQFDRDILVIDVRSSRLNRGCDFVLLWTAGVGPFPTAPRERVGSQPSWSHGKLCPAIEMSWIRYLAGRYFEPRIRSFFYCLSSAKVSQEIRTLRRGVAEAGILTVVPSSYQQQLLRPQLIRGNPWPAFHGSKSISRPERSCSGEQRVILPK